MKRICFLTESVFSYGGVQRVTAVIAKELSKSYEVTVATFDDPQSQNTSLYGLNEASVSYEFLHYPTPGKFKQMFCKAYSLLYRRVLPQTALTSALYAHSSFPSELRRVLTDSLNARDYDAIIAVHAPMATRLAAIRDDLRCKNLIGWIHNSYNALFAEGSCYAGKELENYFIYQFQRLQHTVVLCHCDVEPYQRIHGFKPEVVHNPLTLTPGKPSNGQSKRFLAAGRFAHRHKGFDLLIKAFAIFAKNDGEWTLDIVGEGPEEELYRRLIAEHHLEDRVFLHPFTNDLQAYYSAAQVYVLSSRWEGFGLVLVEAMAHGLPVVSSDLPTSHEIMGDFALYFPNGDIEGLAHQLKQATLTDWKAKSEEAFLIAAQFNVETIADEWKSLIV